MSDNGIGTSARVHDRRLFSARHFDTYEFTIPSGEIGYRRTTRWLIHDPSLPRLYIPIQFGKSRFLLTQRELLKRQGNDHLPLPLFYLMCRVATKEGEAFGIPVDPKTRAVSQKSLVDEFQFCVFTLLLALPQGDVVD